MIWIEKLVSSLYVTLSGNSKLGHEGHDVSLCNTIGML